MHLILPFAVLIYCYSQLILKVKKLASLQEAARSYETIVIRRTIILLSIYACSWAPFHCIQMFEVFFPCSKYHFHFLQSLQEISVFVGYAGSCINPFVYAVVTDDFRNDILTFLDESQGLEKFMCCLQMELDYEICRLMFIQIRQFFFKLSVVLNLRKKSVTSNPPTISTPCEGG